MTTTSRPPAVRSEMTLAHWRMAGANHTLRLDAALLTDPPTRLAAQPLEMGEPPPDEMVEYDALMATEDHWMLRLWSYDRESGRYGARWTKLRLKLSPKTVFVQLGTPAGVPAMWNHFTWASASLGRVASMKASGGELRGIVALSSLALASWGTSHAQLGAGMNAGLSIGCHLYDEPKMKRADGETGGTFDNPDELIYARLRVTEVSLTAMPMIPQAGLMGRKGDADG